MEVKIILDLSAKEFACIQNKVEELLPENMTVEDMQQISQDIMQRFVNYLTGADSIEGMEDILKGWIENYGDDLEDIVLDQAEEIKQPLQEILQVGKYYSVFNVYSIKREPMKYLGFYASEYTPEEEKDNPEFWILHFEAVHPRQPNEKLIYGPSKDQIDPTPLQIKEEHLVVGVTFQVLDNETGNRELMQYSHKQGDSFYVFQDAAKRLYSIDCSQLGKGITF